MTQNLDKRTRLLLASTTAVLVFWGVRSPAMEWYQDRLTQEEVALTQQLMAWPASLPQAQHTRYLAVAAPQAPSPNRAAEMEGFAELQAAADEFFDALGFRNDRWDGIAGGDAESWALVPGTTMADLPPAAIAALEALVGWHQTHPEPVLVHPDMLYASTKLWQLTDRPATAVLAGLVPVGHPFWDWAWRVQVEQWNLREPELIGLERLRGLLTILQQRPAAARRSLTDWVPHTDRWCAPVVDHGEMDLQFGAFGVTGRYLELMSMEAADGQSLPPDLTGVDQALDFMEWLQTQERAGASWWQIDPPLPGANAPERWQGIRLGALLAYRGRAAHAELEAARLGERAAADLDLLAVARSITALPAFRDR